MRDKRAAETREVTIPVATKDDSGEKQVSEFQAELPVSLGDAIAVYGEKDVFRRFVNSLVVHLQAGERAKLKGSTKGTRTRASYLEEIGL